MSGFSVREFEELPVVDKLGPHELERRVLTVGEVDELDELGRCPRIRLVDHTARNKVRFRQFVGLVRVGGRDIEILPKIESPDGDPDQASIRKNLLAMLLASLETDVHLFGDASSNIALSSWLDIFIRIFCRQLAEQARRGLVKRYRLEEDDLGNVRGSIVIHDQIRRNFVHKERIACEFDELDEDHALNQMLKLAVARMLRVARDAGTLRLAREVLTSFEGVSLRTLDGEWWRQIRLDRMSARFEPCRRMAELFLSGFSPDVGRGANDSFALLFDMNVLFEDYIGRRLRAQLAGQGLRVELQHASHYLMHPEDGVGNLFRLKPDIVVFEGRVAQCVGDTKWKRLDGNDRKLGVSQADLYQMLAYARRYPCDRILMIYPYERAGASLNSGGHLLRYQNQNTTVLIGQVCLAELSTVGMQLEALYSRAIAGVLP